MNKFLFGHEAIWKNAIFLLRVWTGVIFIRYGLSIWSPDKMDSFAAMLEQENIPLSVLSAWLCKLSEFFGGIFLITGFLRRPACILLLIDMSVATFVFGQGQLLQNGMTTFILLICCATILLSAPDKLSVDWLIHQRKKSNS
ncbi:MAG TPA: DoxX family protein [Bacteroidia bacterium]|nr:DoxX family protein [Bacteroidia bacterium]